MFARVISRTRSVRALAGGVILALVLAACGGGSKQSPATTPTTSTSPAAGPSPLAVYLLRSGEGGFTVSTPIDQTTVAEWVSVSQSTAADGRRVRGEGFREALEQPTSTTSGGGGLDFVLELGSAAAAGREEAVELKEDVAEQGHVPVTHFRVSGIPGSDGIAASGGKRGTAANVLFTEGRCLLLVGNGAAGGSKADVVAGALAIYRRSHASSGACTTGAPSQL
jgi:hypothetical protein